MPKLAKVLKQHATFDFAYGGEVFKVSYNPSVVTSRFADELGEPGTQAEAAETLMKLNLVWDATDENDAIIELTADVLLDLPTSLMGALIKAVIQDTRVPNDS